VNPDRLAILLGAMRALVLNPGAAAALLHAYDAAGDEIIHGFHAAGFSAEELMALERNLRLLRDALWESRPDDGGPPAPRLKSQR
jgi:hypothetical protein